MILMEQRNYIEIRRNQSANLIGNNKKIRKSLSLNPQAYKALKEQSLQTEHTPLIPLLD
jgi:hypothetical protein